MGEEFVSTIILTGWKHQSKQPILNISYIFSCNTFLALNVLLCVQICEDIPQYLDSDVPGLAERPINIFLPRLFRVTSAFSFYNCFLSSLVTVSSTVYFSFYFIFVSVFPISSCFIEKAIIGFCKSIHYVNAFCKCIVRL